MLTWKEKNGTWGVYGVDFRDCNDNMYGALCKLRDYENTGLEPSDFRSCGYEKLLLYKVFYRYTGDRSPKRILCETRENAEFIADMLRRDGAVDVVVNQYQWQTFVED